MRIHSPFAFLFFYFFYFYREILMNAFRVMVNNPFKESFYEKKKLTF